VGFGGGEHLECAPRRGRKWLSWCREQGWDAPAVPASASRSTPPNSGIDGPGTGWDLHELRHSGLTHLDEAGASLLELMAKSRHRKAENLRRYFKPSPQAMRDLTSLIGPGADRRH
jgi:hypothetical protein